MKNKEVRNIRDYNKKMKEIIRFLRVNKRLPDSTNDDVLKECIFSCVEDGYIMGLHLERNANGDVTGELTTAKITRKGYCFLSFNINWSYVMSAFSLIVSIATLVTRFLGY